MTFLLDPATHVGPLSLAVSDLERARHFYEDILAFARLELGEGWATLGTAAGLPLLHLMGQPRATPKPPRSTGLYHFAILYPERQALARALRRLVQGGYAIQGAADHLVSEAIYLADPDGNGIELYRDRPRAAWPKPGEPLMATLPLDLRALLAEADAPARNLPDGTMLGHIHLHVAHLEPAIAFYRDLLGLELMMRFGESAAFLAAGGYHHHVGLNTWAGVGAAPPPADAVGLRHWTLLLADEDERQRLAAHLHAHAVAVTDRDGALTLVDPSGNRVAIRAAPAAPVL